MRFPLLLIAAPVVAGSFLLAGCGGDSAGSDEDFVKDLCDASTQLETDLDTAIADASSQTDPEKAIEALVPPLEDFVEAFKDANPPEDLEDWHETASDQLETEVEEFKEAKSLEELEGFGDSPVPDPPAEAKSRLRTAAEDVEECEGVTFMKPD